MALDLSGFANHEPTSWDLKKPDLVLFNGVKIKWTEIKGFLGEYYYSAVAIYNRFKRYGFPYSGGWAEQPEYIVQLIDVFESTIDKYHSHEREIQERKSNGNSRRTTSSNRRKG